MPNIMQVAASAQGSSVKSESAGGLTDVEMLETNGREFAELMQAPQQGEAQRQLFARQEIPVEAGQRQFSRPSENNELPQSSLIAKLSADGSKNSDATPWIDTIERMRDLLVSDDAKHGEDKVNVELDADNKAMLDKVAQWLEKLDGVLVGSQSGDVELSAEQQQALQQLVDKVESLRQVVAAAEQTGTIQLDQLDQASEDLLAQLSRVESEVVKPQQAKQWADVEQLLSGETNQDSTLPDRALSQLQPEQKQWLKEQLTQFRQNNPDASLEEGMAHVKSLLSDVKQLDAAQHQTLVAWVETYQSQLQKTDNTVRLVAVPTPTFQPQKAVSEGNGSEAKVTEPSASATDTSKFQQVKNEDGKPAAEQSLIAKMVKDELRGNVTGNAGASATSDVSTVLSQASNASDNLTNTQQTQQSSSHVSAVTQTQQTLTKIDGMSLAQAQSAVDKPLDLQQQDAAQKMQERIQMMVSKNIQRADIRLDPPELGSMHVRIHTQGDQTTVQFQVQSAQARDAIEQTMPRLREMLEQQGLNLAESSVSEQQRERGEGANGGQGIAGQSETDESVAQLEASVDDFLEQGRLDFYV